jgi:hypothetical protein
MIRRYLGRAALALALLVLLAGVAEAYVNYSDAAGASWSGTVIGWLNGSSLPVPVSSANPLPVTGVNAAPASIAPVAASSALESGHVLKASGGTFYGVQVNTTTSPEWVMLFNQATLPGNGTVTPALWWQVPANATLSVNEAPGLAYGAGITVACSTTGPFTLTTSTLCTFGGGVVQ